MILYVLTLALLAGPAVEPIQKGAKAPFAGLLVPEDRFLELLEAENQAHKLEVELRITEQTSLALEQLYQRKLDEALIVPWYDSPTFNRWLGVFLGGAVAGVAVWAAVEIQTATR